MHKARQERAMIMEKAKKDKAKKEKVNLIPPTPASVSTVKPKTSAVRSVESATKPIYYSSSGQDGVGLWCHATQRNDSSQLPPTQTQPSHLTSDIDQKLNSEMVTILQKKCTKLGKEFEKEKVLRAQCQTENDNLKGYVEMLKAENEGMKTQLDNLQGMQEVMGKEMDEQCINRNYLETQLESLHKEIENEKQRADAYRKLYDQETAIKEEEFEEYENEISLLKQHLTMAQEQLGSYSEYLSQLQLENDSLKEEKEKLGQKFIQEITAGKTKEEKAKEKSTKINILMGENRAFTQKLKELEENKKKIQEISRQKEEEAKTLKQENENYKRRIKTELDLRKHQIDLVAQRDIRLKLIEDKHSTLEEQFKQLLRENENLKKKKPLGKKPELLPVTARPDLFE